MHFQKKNKYLAVYFVLYVLALLKIFSKSLYEGYTKDSAVISEFLINYQGGFVRRGLLGELILFLYNNFKISPYFLILSISISAFLILIIYFVIKFTRNGYSLFILPFVFFLGNPVIHQFWVRKDILLVLIFLLIILLSVKKNFLHLVLINLLLITGILIHEEIGFICFPVLFLLHYQKNGSSEKSKISIHSILLPILQLSLSLFAFGMVLYFKGSALISTTIWNSWKNVPFPHKSVDDQTIPVAIDALSWSLKKGLSLSQTTFFNFDNGVHSFLGWGLIISGIYYLLSNLHLLNFPLFKQKGLRDVSSNKSLLSDLLLIQFFSVIPLFILGYDYSRWIFLWVCSSFILFFTVPREIVNSTFPASISSLRSKINIYLDSVLSKSVSFMFLLTIVIGFPPADWRLLACLQSSSLIILLKFISIPFYILLHIVFK